MTFDTVTQFPNGVGIWGPLAGGPGVPLLPAGPVSYFGKVYFVDTVNGSDGNSGTSPAAAFLTMGRAFWVDNSSAAGVAGAGARATSNLNRNDTVFFVGKVREQLVAPLLGRDGTALTGVQIIGGCNGNVRDDDGAKWYAPASPVAGKALIEIRQQGWVFRNFLMTPDTTTGACIKAHRAEDATYPDSSHFVVSGMRFVGGSGTQYGIEDVGGNHHYIVQDSEFQSLTRAITCTSTGVAVPLRNTIRRNTFKENTMDVATSLSYSLIQNNQFFTAGSGATNKVVSTTFNSTQGGNNQILLNQFNNTEVEIAPGSGYTGAATDLWMNYVNNQAALAFGQPA